MVSCADRLQQALADYRQLETEYVALAAALVAGDDWRVAEGLEALPELEARLRQADIVAWIADGDWWSEPAVDELRTLVGRVAEQNRTLASRARTLLALAAEERSQLQGGQVAMAGYRPAPDGTESVFTTRG